jgi:hypothetical protein
MVVRGKVTPARPDNGAASHSGDRHEYRVFIASPGDVVAERRAFKDRIDELNAGFGDGAGVVFIPLGWEDTLASTGRRIQSVINRDIDACDVFVLQGSGKVAPSGVSAR